MTRGNYGHYEQGGQQPSMGDVPALARAMGVHPCDFFKDIPPVSWTDGPSWTYGAAGTGQPSPAEPFVPSFEQSYERAGLKIVEGLHELGVEPERAMQLVQFLAWQSGQPAAE